MGVFLSVRADRGSVQLESILEALGDAPALAARIESDGFSVEVRANITRRASGRQGYFSMPVDLRSVLSDVVRCEIIPLTEALPTKQIDIVPLSPLVRFRARVKTFGREWFVHVPLSWWRGMTVAGWDMFVRVRIAAGQEIVFSREIARRRTAATITIPLEYVSALTPGQEVIVELRPLERVRTQTEETVFSSDGFCWASFVSGLAEMSDEQITIVGQRSQHRLRAVTEIESTMWALGVYLAEGNKSGNDFSISNKSASLLRRFAGVLSSWGIAQRKLSLEIVEVGYGEEEALRWFESVGIPPVGVRRQHHGPIFKDKESKLINATLRVRGSKGFAQVVLRALQKLDPSTVPAKAARAFALGYLDGDGTLTYGSPPSLRTASASMVEAEIIRSALVRGFGWENTGKFETSDSGNMVSFSRTLSIMDAVLLLDAGAFSYSLSRARLFYSIADRLDGAALAQIVRAGIGGQIFSSSLVVGSFSRWGLITAVSGGYRLSDRFTNSLAVWEKHADEWSYVKHHYPAVDDVTTGQKGLLYDFDPAWSQVIESKEKQNEYRRNLYARKRDGDPSITHPHEKQEQIRRVLSGRVGLRVYEVYGGLGHCSAAYVGFGTTTSRSRDDGDALEVTRREIFFKHRYDVLDIDGYGYPTRLLHSGCLSLLGPGGWLFLTFPNPSKHPLVGDVRREVEAVFGRAKIQMDDVGGLVGKLALLERLGVNEVDRLDLGSVWRLVYQFSARRTG